MFFRRFLVVGGSLLTCLSLLFSTAGAQDVSINQYSSMERISAGGESVGGGSTASISSDGRYVVFESTASDLLPDTIDDSHDVIVRDRQAGAFERASVSNTEQVTYNIGEYTSPPVISGTGRHIAFVSQSSSLISSGDDNGMPDVFARDRNGYTTLISVALDGTSGNGASFNPAISASARYVAFQSFSTDLTDNDQNRSIDIFLRDRQEARTELISITDEGLQGDDASEYGFSSVAVSDDGRYVAFSYDYLPIPGHVNNGGPYVYVRDRNQDTIRLIAQGTFPSLSVDGRYLVFLSNDSLVIDDQNNVVDVYLYDQQLDRFERISVTSVGGEVPDQWINNAPDVSADGRYVVFQSSYDGMTVNDMNGLTDIYLRDRSLHKTLLISGGVNSVAGNGDSYQPAINDDGTLVTFTSWASDLVINDTNDRVDVFAMNLAELGVLPGQVVLPRMYLPVVGSRSTP